MCGRFVLFASGDEVAERFQQAEIPALEALLGQAGDLGAPRFDDQWLGRAAMHGPCTR